MTSVTLILVMTSALFISSSNAQTPSGSTAASLVAILGKLAEMTKQPQLSLAETMGPVQSASVYTATPVLPGSSNTGTSIAKLLSGDTSGTTGGSGTSNSVSSVSSQSVGNDIISKVQAFVSQQAKEALAYQPTVNGAPMPSFGASMAPSGSNLPGGVPGYSMPGFMSPGMDPTAGIPGGPMPPASMGSLGGIPGMPPMTSMEGMLTGMMMGPVQNQAMLSVGRRLGQKLGVRQYYEIHGCVDPTQLFSGKQKAMATMAMAQGCHSFRAMQICHMAQVKERTGNSLLTSRVLPPLVRSRVESCLSAKTLFNPMGIPSVSSPSSSSSPFGGLFGSFLGPPSGESTAVPSLRECGLLMSSVMDGGSLDPESMISTRRSMLPWSCNEGIIASNNIPYRVCCPGRVVQPTLQEAHIIRRMVN